MSLETYKRAIDKIWQQYLDGAIDIAEVKQQIIMMAQHFADRV